MDSSSNVEPKESDGLDEESQETRKRSWTEKGRQYQLEIKTKSLKAKRLELTIQVRSTLLLRGQGEHVYVVKREFSKSQVLYGEFGDIFGEISELTDKAEALDDVRRLKEQTELEWSGFENDMRAEITYLEQLNIVQQRQSCSVASSMSKKYSRLSSVVSSKLKRSNHSSKSTKSKASSANSVKSEKFHLQQEQAALRVKLTFAEEETKLKLEQRRVEFEKNRTRRKIGTTSVKK